MTLKKPKALKRGDVVALVSPSSPVTEEKVGPVTQLLEAQGYRIKVFPHAFDSDGYLAGADCDRASDLQAAFDDPEVNAILCTRGGYGSARLTPFLDFDRMAQARKLFAGFSDITTLHLGLNRRGLATLHSPMALTLFYQREAWVYDSFLRALQGDLSISPDVPTGTTVREGLASGVATGGCLCLLADSVGTPDELDVEGKILFVEDVDEAPHRVDAMLTHLLNAGILQKAAGIAFGEMTRTDERADSAIGNRSWRDIVRERTDGLSIPIIVDFPFGHSKNMLSLGLGVQVELDGTRGTVRYLESLCA